MNNTSQSVKSINPWQSLPTGQAGVIQTIYEIAKALDGGLKVATMKGKGTEFVIIQLPVV
ncbi:MAG: hypothetical protein ACKVOW_14760 [Chitinophagaceae bacterium]